METGIIGIVEFGKNMANEVKKTLGVDYSVEYTDIVKNNGVIYHAIVVKRLSEAVAPTIYLELFYDKFKKGYPMKELVDDFVDVYKKYKPSEKLDVDFFMDFASVCEHLTFKVVGYEKNIDLLKDIPYKTIEDLALVPCCLLEMKDMGEGSITIKKSHLDKWEISEAELWENIFENAAKVAPVKYQSLLDFIYGRRVNKYMDDVDDSDKETTDPLCNMYVVTNKSLTNGASAVFYPGVLEKLSSKLGTDIIIIPSSIHETIIMPAMQNAMEIQGLIRMVREVNSNVVADLEILSDNVYLYSKENKKITMIG